jgi:hypothetical protein
MTYDYIIRNGWELRELEDSTAAFGGSPAFATPN